MGNISTFGTFTTIKLGIYAASRGFSVTGNNISNVNTKGYTRQQIDQKSMHVGGTDRYLSANDIRIGNGAFVTGISQLRDPFLDIQYRTEMASVGANSALMDGYKRLEDVLNEVFRGEDENGNPGPGIIEAQLNDIVSQIENLATQGPGLEYYDTLVRSSVETLCRTFKSYATDLEAARQDLDTEFRQDLDTVNSILKSIRNLNEQIRTANVYGSDALEQKDERNNLIDQLSEYMRIEVIYGVEKLGGQEVEKLTIRLKGDEPLIGDDLSEAEKINKINKSTLIDGIFGTQLSIAQVPAIDENGNNVYEEDEEGNQVLKMVDSPFYDLILGPLTDRRLNIMETASETVDYEEPAGTPVTFNKKEDAENKVDMLPTVIKDGIRYSYSVATNREVSEPKQVKKDDPTYTFDDRKEALDKKEALEKLSPAEQAKELGITLADGQTYKFTVNKSPDDPAKYVVNYTVTTTTYHIQEKRETLSQPVELMDNTLYGSLQSKRELLTEEGEFASAEDAQRDTNATSKRGIPYYQKALDALANKFAEIMNKANGFEPETVTEGEKFTTTAPTKLIRCTTRTPADATSDTVLYLKAMQKADGNWYFLTTENCNLTEEQLKVPQECVDGKTLDLTTAGGNDDDDLWVHLGGKNGGPVTDRHGVEVTSNDTDYKNWNELEEVTGWVSKTKTVWNQVKEDPFKRAGVLISNDRNKDNAENITASNISIAHSWATGVTRIVQDFNSSDSTAQENYRDLLVAMTSGVHDFKPSDIGVHDAYHADQAYFRGTLQGMLTNMNEQLATDTHVTNTMLTNYNTTADELWIERDAISGVDLNDEAMNMMQYQKAYSAACRCMTTFDSMLDKLINGT